MGISRCFGHLALVVQQHAFPGVFVGGDAREAMPKSKAKVEPVIEEMASSDVEIANITSEDICC